MSKIGPNIKKIRSINKLSQSEFAKIFNLTRGTIGAYEEGRAEPKIDAIIQIANYFNLSIDVILNKELTVNELLSLDILNEKLDAAHRFDKKSVKAYRKGGIGLVRIKAYLEYTVNYQNKDFISNLPYIELPVNFKGITRAFELNGSEMEYHQNGLHHGDILLSLFTPLEKIKPSVGNVYVIVRNEGITARRLKMVDSDTLTFSSDDPNYPDINIDSKTILELWIVKGTYSTYLNPPKMLDERMMLLERKMQDIEKNMKDLGKR